MLDREMTASLKNIVKANEVRLDITAGIGDRITHASLSCEIYNHCWLILLKKMVDDTLVRNIAFDECP